MTTTTIVLFISPSCVTLFCFVFSLFPPLPLSCSLIGCGDHAHYFSHLPFSFSLACYNVDRFVAFSRFCVRLQLKTYTSILLCYIILTVRK